MARTIKFKIPNPLHQNLIAFAREIEVKPSEIALEMKKLEHFERFQHEIIKLFRSQIKKTGISKSLMFEGFHPICDKATL